MRKQAGRVAPECRQPERSLTAIRTVWRSSSLGSPPGKEEKYGLPPSKMPQRPAWRVSNKCPCRGPLASCYQTLVMEQSWSESLGCVGWSSVPAREQQELILRYVGNRNRCIFHFLAVKPDVSEQVPGFDPRVNRQLETCDRKPRSMGSCFHNASLRYPRSFSPLMLLVTNTICVDVQRS